MKSVLIFVSLLLLGCALLKSVDDVFAPDPVVRDELERAVFVMNPEKRAYSDDADDFDPWSYTKECIDIVELELIRVLQAEGVDFMGVNGSFLMIPNPFRKSIGFVYPYRYEIIIINTHENLDRAEEVLSKFSSVRLGKPDLA